MKTKKLLLMAAMLLMSVCSFAQDNNTPLVGDVNGDGKVDVADIVAILKIMKDAGGAAGEPTYYFSIGTTAITIDNYTTANNATTTIPTSINFSTTVRGYGYILAPSNKTITVVDADDNAPITFEELTSIIIENHKVYKTAVLNVGGTIKITLSK